MTTDPTTAPHESENAPAACSECCPRNGGCGDRKQLRAELERVTAERDGWRETAETHQNLRRVRAYAVREAIGAVAAHGPGVDWPARLEEWARFVETYEPDADDAPTPAPGQDDRCDLSAGRCDSCGACIVHDGCADAQNPAREGDCEDCGACAACIAECERQAAPAPASGDGTDAGQEVLRVALDGAAHSVWLHGKWRWLTRQMTTEEREAFADAVERHSARLDSDDAVTVDRWWRAAAVDALGEVRADG